MSYSKQKNLTADAEKGNAQTEYEGGLAGISRNHAFFSKTSAFILGADVYLLKAGEL